MPSYIDLDKKDHHNSLLAIVTRVYDKSKSYIYHNTHLSLNDVKSIFNVAGLDVLDERIMEIDPSGSKKAEKGSYSGPSSPGTPSLATISCVQSLVNAIEFGDAPTNQ